MTEVDSRVDDPLSLFKKFERNGSHRIFCRDPLEQYRKSRIVRITDKSISYSFPDKGFLVIMRVIKISIEATEGSFTLLCSIKGSIIECPLNHSQVFSE